MNRLHSSSIVYAILKARRLLCQRRSALADRGRARVPPDPPGGWQRLNLVQFTSIYLNLVRDGLAFRHLVEPGEEVLGQLAFGRRRFSGWRRGQRAADDSAGARQRGPRKRWFVSMRGNDSKNESRLKSYGRFLNKNTRIVRSSATPQRLVSFSPLP